MSTIRNRGDTIWKIRDGQGNWYVDQEGIFNTITNEIQKKSKLDTSTDVGRSISLSKDIIEAENEILTIESSDMEILKAVKHIKSLKAPGPDDKQVVFCRKCWRIIS